MYLVRVCDFVECLHEKLSVLAGDVSALVVDFVRVFVFKVMVKVNEGQRKRGSMIECDVRVSAGEC